MKLSWMLLVTLLVLVHTRQGYSKTTSDGGPRNGFMGEKNYELLLRIVREGGHRGLTECQHQFKNEIWNCSLGRDKNVYKQLPIFVKKTLTHATRETAFIHAISSAAITHEFTHQCNQNKIPGCKCGKTRKQPKANSGWQWGGCSDDIKFGEKETSRFIDKLEKGKDARTAFNLHNNEVGRKVVRANLRKVCKCHGVTGGCNLKTCWKQLSPFTVVGSELKKIYRAAVRVPFLNNKLRARDNNRNRLVTKKEKKLVYLDSSPDYCVRNATAGSPGMLGRTCQSEDASREECRSLCNSCNLRHRTVEHKKQVKCRCKFVWCCTVKCKVCSVKYSLTTCV